MLGEGKLTGRRFALHYNTGTVLQHMKTTQFEWKFGYSNAFFQREVPPTDTSPLWWSEVVHDFAIVPSAELPPGTGFGISFTTFAVNVPKYLQHLLKQIVALGGRTIRARLPTDGGLQDVLQEAKNLSGADEIWAFINATGFGAREVAGDTSVTPIRGQTILVQGEAKQITTRLGKNDNDIQCIIPRPRSGTSIVGVTKEPGVWSTISDKSKSSKLLEGGKQLASELLDDRGEFKVVSVNVGLRPWRKDGPRLELEKIGDEMVVHEYGHSGAGYVLRIENGLHLTDNDRGRYQSSVGSANKVLQLLRGSLNGSSATS